MKYTLPMLIAVLNKATSNAMHVQGDTPDAHCIISCKHPKYNTILYVSEVGRKFIKYSGNIHNALKLTSAAAKNVRDDVLEHKTQVVIHGY